MITVNLLPPEYRRKDRTPLRVFGTLLLGIVLLCGTAFYYARLNFGELATVEANYNEVKTELSGLKPQVDHHDSLVKEKRDYLARVETIQTISKSRISWTKKIDELVDIVNAGEPRYDDEAGYLVWFGNLNIKQNPLAKGSSNRRGGEAGGTVQAAGFCASPHMSAVTRFFDDLEGNEDFFRDFSRIDDVSGAMNNTQDETVEPSQVWSFPLVMPINIPDAKDKK